jgi:hypothetical protein
MQVGYIRPISVIKWNCTYEGSSAQGKVGSSVQVASLLCVSCSSDCWLCGVAASTLCAFVVTLTMATASTAEVISFG